MNISDASAKPTNCWAGDPPPQTQTFPPRAIWVVPCSMCGQFPCVCYVPVFRPEPIRTAWECPRCNMINSPWVDQCTCLPNRQPYITDTTSGTAAVRAEGQVLMNSDAVD